MYHFYEVYNAFISSFKKHIYGPIKSILYVEETSFLDKRGCIEAMEHFITIMLYYSHEKSSYLSYYVSDKIFFVEV
jgi:hypothetical protein